LEETILFDTISATDLWACGIKVHTWVADLSDGSDNQTVICNDLPGTDINVYRHYKK